ncbi:hypothetical protein [Absidia glauca]|uniref:PHD-type domain-containing protein n=1 Tax=Absidia glauca TaxID=4829 RepID=A0A163KHM9_ABSGL|nr:hypothetical protein [Absidia glauca]
MVDKKKKKKPKVPKTLRTERKNKNQVKDDEPLFCLCQQPYKKGQLMVTCDSCHEWFHYSCVGIEPQAEIDHYHCATCQTGSSKHPSPIEITNANDRGKNTSKKRTVPTTSSSSNKKSRTKAATKPASNDISLHQRVDPITTALNSASQEDEDLDDLCPVCELECVCGSSALSSTMEPSVSPPSHTTRVPDKSSTKNRRDKPHLDENDTDILDSYDSDHRTAIAASAVGNTTGDSDSEDLSVDPTVDSTKVDFSNNISDSNDDGVGYLVEDDDDSDGLGHDASDPPSSPSDDEHTYYLQTNGLWATSDEDDDEDDMAFHSNPSLALNNGNPDSFTPGGNSNNSVFTNTLDTLLHDLPSSPHPDRLALRPTPVPRFLNAATFDLGSNAAAYLSSAPTSPTDQRMDDFFRRLSLPSSTVLAAHGQQDMDDLLPSLLTSESSPPPAGDAPSAFAFSFPPSPPPLPEISAASLSAHHGKSPMTQPSSSLSSSPPQIKYDLASLLPVNMKIPDQLLDMIKASLAASSQKDVAATDDGAVESSKAAQSVQGRSDEEGTVSMEELLDLSKLDARSSFSDEQHVSSDLSRWDRVPIGAFRLMRQKNRRWLNR